jgi:hypothetical protein
MAKVQYLPPGWILLSGVSRAGFTFFACLSGKMKMYSFARNGLKTPNVEIDNPADRKYNTCVVVSSVLPDSSGDGRQSKTWRLFHLKGHGKVTILR